MKTDIVIGEVSIDFYVVGRGDIWVPLQLAIEQSAQFYGYYKEIWSAEERTPLETGELYSVMPEGRHLLGDSAYIISVFGLPWFCSHRLESVRGITFWMDPIADLLHGYASGRIGSWTATEMEARLIGNTLWFQDKSSDGFIRYPARRVLVEQLVPQFINVGRGISEFSNRVFRHHEEDSELGSLEKEVVEADRLGYLLKKAIGWVREPTDRLEAAYEEWQRSNSNKCRSSLDTPT